MRFDNTFSPIPVLNPKGQDMYDSLVFRGFWKIMKVYKDISAMQLHDYARAQNHLSSVLPKEELSYEPDAPLKIDGLGDEKLSSIQILILELPTHSFPWFMIEDQSSVNITYPDYVEWDSLFKIILDTPKVQRWFFNEMLLDLSTTFNFYSDIWDFKIVAENIKVQSFTDWKLVLVITDIFDSIYRVMNNNKQQLDKLLS